MSTITVTNIKATGETASRGVNGVAGAYGYFLQTTNTSGNQSLNVSSFTDVSAGAMNFNFTNAFADAVYSKAGIASSSNDYMSSSFPNTTTSVARMQNAEEGTGLKDANNQVIFHGDLA
tara:strand:- start:40 stop:396 length:357 start_codon:yes stop_codon:yes gene_type:complete